MDIEQARLFALSLPHATEYMPFGDDYIVFRIGGKIFMALPLDGQLDTRITIKLPPELGQELREHYEGVRPAWHWNKKHWNDIMLEHSDFTDAHIKEWITISYNTVRDKLPRTIRATLSPAT